MVPLIVNTCDPMAKVRVVTTKDYSTKTLKALHTAGVQSFECFGGVILGSYYPDFSHGVACIDD